MRQFAIEREHAVLHRAGLRDQHRQHPARRKPRKMNMLQHLAGRGAGQRHAQPARKQRQHVRGALQVFIGAATPLKLSSICPRRASLRLATPRCRPRLRARSHAACLRNLLHVVAETPQR